MKHQRDSLFSRRKRFFKFSAYPARKNSRNSRANDASCKSKPAAAGMLHLRYGADPSFSSETRTRSAATGRSGDYRVRRTTRTMENILSLALLESLHKRVTCLRGESVVRLSGYIKRKASRSPLPPTPPAAGPLPPSGKMTPERSRRKGELLRISPQLPYPGLRPDGREFRARARVFPAI